MEDCFADEDRNTTNLDCCICVFLYADKERLPTPPLQHAPSPPLRRCSAMRRLDFDPPVISPSPDIINAIPTKKRTHSHPFATSIVVSTSSEPDMPDSYSPHELVLQWLREDEEDSGATPATDDTLDNSPGSQQTFCQPVRATCQAEDDNRRGHCVVSSTLPRSTERQRVRKDAEVSLKSSLSVDGLDRDFKSVAVSDWYQGNDDDSQQASHPVITFLTSPSRSCSSSSSSHERSDSFDSAVSMSSDTQDSESSNRSARAELMVIAKFTPSSSNEVSVSPGDIVLARPDASQRGWLWVQVVHSGAHGYIPFSYTRPLTLDV